MRRSVLAAAVACAAAASACKGKGDDSSGNRTAPAGPSGASGSAGPGAASGSAAAPPAPTPPPVPLAADPGGATGAVRWATSLGGLGGDWPRAVATGPGDAIAVAGYFDGEATFGKLGARKAVGGSDVFVAGLAADGTPAWVQTFGGPRDDVANGVAIGKDGSVVVVGNFLDEMNVGGQVHKAANSDDLFAAAFAKDGKPLWVWTAGGVDSDGADAVAATPDGGWVIGGSFLGEAKFGDTIYHSMGGNDALLIKLAPTGEVQWVQQMGGTYNDWIRSLAVDAQGNIYLLAEFVDTASFGGPKLPNAGNAGSDLAIAKLDASGKHVWSKSLGSKTIDVAGGVAVDPAGNVTITGSFEGSVIVDGQSYGSVGQYDVLVVHMDPTGATKWVKSWGGEGTDLGNGIAADASGNVVVTGLFELSMLVGQKTLSSKGNRDIFVVKLDPNGALVWADDFGDHDHDQGRAVALDSKGNPIVAAAYRFKFDGVTPPIESVHADGDKLPKPDVLVIGLAR